MKAGEDGVDAPFPALHCHEEKMAMIMRLSNAAYCALQVIGGDDAQF
jgi:hypothetical protein